jgi:hypothetical protein
MPYLPDFDNATPYTFFRKFSSYSGVIDRYFLARSMVFVKASLLRGKRIFSVVTVWAMSKIVYAILRRFKIAGTLNVKVRKVQTDRQTDRLLLLFPFYWNLT